MSESMDYARNLTLPPGHFIPTIEEENLCAGADSTKVTIQEEGTVAADADCLERAPPIADSPVVN